MTTAEKPVMELTRNPVDGSWGFVCREHGIHRYGLTEPHAINVERKHQREDHADPLLVELDLQALARFVTSWRATTRQSGKTGRAVAIQAWLQLTDLPEPEALALAEVIAARREPVRVAVVPL